MTTILLVEDHELNRYVLSKLLKKMGFDVELAINGADSIEKAQTEAIDLILMDMNLPDIGGWEVVGILKSSEVLKHIPVIGLSAHTEGPKVEQAKSNGCDDFDTKPIDLERLVQKISQFLPAELMPSGTQHYLNEV